MHGVIEENEGGDGSKLITLEMQIRKLFPLLFLYQLYDDTAVKNEACQPNNTEFMKPIKPLRDQYAALVPSRTRTHKHTLTHSHTHTHTHTSTHLKHHNWAFSLLKAKSAALLLLVHLGPQ